MSRTEQSLWPGKCDDLSDLAMPWVPVFQLRSKSESPLYQMGIRFHWARRRQGQWTTDRHMSMLSSLVSSFPFCSFIKDRFQAFPAQTHEKRQEEKHLILMSAHRSSIGELFLAVCFHLLLTLVEILQYSGQELGEQTFKSWLSWKDLSESPSMLLCLFL